MNENKPYSDLANLVSSARKDLGLSQRKLSGLLGMSNSYATHLESGNIQPTVETLHKISSLLELPYAKLAVLANYIDSKNSYNLHRLEKLNDLTDDELNSVLDYAEFIRSKRIDKSTFN
tara:strand:- start:2690 stop:3046 length:357 start_codon:yes stop_codon:yes gene_type:complete